MNNHLPTIRPKTYLRACVEAERGRHIDPTWLYFRQCDTSCVSLTYGSSWREANSELNILYTNKFSPVCHMSSEKIAFLLDRP